MIARSMWIASVVAAFASAASADPPSRMSLDDAVAAAIANHPHLRAAKARGAEARARTDQARLLALPAAGLAGELERATGNTTPGAFAPLAGVVPISGPVVGHALDGGSWQTGVSAWAAWDTTSFARRSAALAVGDAGEREADAATELRELDVAYEAADAFLALLAAQESVDAAHASLERARVFHTIVGTLVQQSLRPGVDEARVQAELTAAEIAVARAEQAKEIQRARLAQAMGTRASAPIEPIAGALLGAAPALGDHIARDTHPLVKQAAAELARTSALEHVVALDYVPRIDLFASLWVRGSGTYDPVAAGLVPEVRNWAAGVTATWNVFEIPAIRARARAAAAETAVATADRDDAALAVVGEAQRAAAVLRGALTIAQETPVALAAARAAEQQVTARYQAGLAQVTDVADTERILAQAEADDAVARVEVWRATLLVAKAAGDLTPVLAAARRAP